MTLLLLPSMADRLLGQWYMVLLVKFWFVWFFVRLTYVISFFGTYLITIWYASSNLKVCYIRRCNYWVYNQYVFLICFLVMDTDEFCMGSSITFLEVYKKSIICDVTCIVIGMSVDLYCCPCIDRLSRMASKMICCSFFIWLLIRNNMLSNWADGFNYSSSFVRKEPSVWRVWLTIAGVFVGDSFVSWTVISLFCLISCLLFFGLNLFF